MQNDVNNEIKDNMMNTADVTKVLGFRGQPSTDTLTFARREIPVLDHVTKRAILK
jgi:hypothetical protein